MEAFTDSEPGHVPAHAEHDAGGHSTLRSLIWIALIPLVGAALWLGVLVVLRTTSPLEVTIGRSMEPTLHTGDLAIFEGIPPGALRLGDVIPIEVSASNQKQFGYPAKVLHRVIDITLVDGKVIIRTKGDHQDNPDPFTVPVTDVQSRLKTSVPRAGYVLFYLRSTQGRIALAGLVALFLLYEGVRWATDTAEELIDEGPVPVPVQAVPFAPSGFQEFTLAIGEYGVHLRSHTKVVQELGGATEELRATTEMQREILVGLRDSVHELAGQLRGGGIAAPRRPAEPPPAAFAAIVAAPAPPAPAPEAPSGGPSGGDADWLVVDEHTAVRDAVDAPPSEALARPILLAVLRRQYFPRLAVAVQGFQTEREMLEFGAALTMLPTVQRVALDGVRPYGAVFSLDTLHAGLFMDQLHRMHGFSVHPMWAPDGSGEL